MNSKLPSKTDLYKLNSLGMPVVDKKRSITALTFIQNLPFNF